MSESRSQLITTPFEIVEVFEGEVELLPGRLSVDVELN
jgi:hypothetical protein